MNMARYINPGDMATPRGYSHGVAVGGEYAMVFVGGQNAVDGSGNLVGKNDLGRQTEQALANVEKVLSAAGAGLENTVKLGVYLLAGQDPREGFRAFQEKWAGGKGFPAITVLFVAGLASPDWLVEIDAIAVLPR